MNASGYPWLSYNIEPGNGLFFRRWNGSAWEALGNSMTGPNGITDVCNKLTKLALDSAGLDASTIGYVSAHGTATQRGDIAESHATRNVFGENIPISSLKSYMGHTLGACGALESWLAIEMMNNGWFAPTINLENVDPEGKRFLVFT